MSDSKKKKSVCRVRWREFRQHWSIYRQVYVHRDDDGSETVIATFKVGGCDPLDGSTIYNPKAVKAFEDALAYIVGTYYARFGIYDGTRSVR